MNRKVLLFIFVSAILFAVGIMFAPLVFAQAPDTRIDLDPFITSVMPYLLALFGTIISAAIGFATLKLQQWTGINVEAKHREALQSALTNGALNMVAKVTPKGVTIDVGNAAIADGVEYVLKSVPDAVQYFGLTPARVQEMLAPKIAAVAVAAPTEKTVNVTNVTGTK